MDQFPHTTGSNYKNLLSDHRYSIGDTLDEFNLLKQFSHPPGASRYAASNTASSSKGMQKPAQAAAYYLMPTITNQNIMEKNKQLQDIIKGKKRLAHGSIFTSQNFSQGAFV